MLQCAGGERRNGPAHRGLFLDGGDTPIRRLKSKREGASVVFAQEAHLAALLEAAGAFIEIIAGGDFRPAEVRELGIKADALLLERSFQIPVAPTAKGASSPLSLYEQADSHGLNTSGREPPGNFLPQQRREGVADQSVEDSSGFLGMHQLHIELTCVIECPGDRLFCDLVKHHPLDRDLG